MSAKVSCNHTINVVKRVMKYVDDLRGLSGYWVVSGPVLCVDSVYRALNRQTTTVAAMASQLRLLPLCRFRGNISHI